MIELSEYRQVVRLFGQVIDCLEGFEPPDERLLQAQSLALKLFEHAAATYSLAQGVEMEPAKRLPTVASFVKERLKRRAERISGKKSTKATHPKRK